MMGGNNDNDPPEGEKPGVVLEFPTEPIARRRALRYNLTHHADGTPLSADELTYDLRVAVVTGAVEQLTAIAFERSGEDFELASIMLLHAVEVMDRSALVDRAERILGPRRYGPGNTPPVAA